MFFLLEIVFIEQCCMYVFGFICSNKCDGISLCVKVKWFLLCHNDYNVDNLKIIMLNCMLSNVT